MVVHTFPPVLERLGTWSISELPWSGSSTPGDHARFFDGDALRDGAGDGCESLTGTCVILLPRRVCVVVTSNRSGFGFGCFFFFILRLFVFVVLLWGGE